MNSMKAIEAARCVEKVFVHHWNTQSEISAGPRTPGAACTERGALRMCGVCEGSA